jgi:hypothetical protein
MDVIIKKIMILALLEIETMMSLDMYGEGLKLEREQHLDSQFQ